MRIYISGAITGTSGYLYRFAEVEKMFTNKGFTVINPAKVCSKLPNSLSHEEYMHICLPMLDLCDLIYMIPGWEESKGARRELGYAIRRGIRRVRDVD